MTIIVIKVVNEWTYFAMNQNLLFLITSYEYTHCKIVIFKL